MRKLRAWFRNHTEDLLFVAGLLAILYGTYQLNALAAWFVGGVECLIAGFVIAWSKRR